EKKQQQNEVERIRGKSPPQKWDATTTARFLMQTRPLPRRRHHHRPSRDHIRRPIITVLRSLLSSYNMGRKKKIEGKQGKRNATHNRGRCGSMGSGLATVTHVNALLRILHAPMETLRPLAHIAARS
ncbi:Adenylate cyclase, partial [Trypanosoma cruzi]